MMINVLVAEDEPLILNSITKLIHSLDSDFIVCARAKKVWRYFNVLIHSLLI